MTEMTQDTRSHRRLGPGTGSAAAAFALAVGMMGTTLPTPLYALYCQRFGFSELMITVIFAVYSAGVIAALLLLGAFRSDRTPAHAASRARPLHSQRLRLPRR